MTGPVWYVLMLAASLIAAACGPSLEDRSSLNNLSPSSQETGATRNPSAPSPATQPAGAAGPTLTAAPTWEKGTSATRTATTAPIATETTLKVDRSATPVGTRGTIAAAATPHLVGAYPCQPGQIKGNANSMIYHVPGGQFYEKTYANVNCFDSEAGAKASGYRRSQR